MLIDDEYSILLPLNFLIIIYNSLMNKRRDSFKISITIFI